MNLTSAICGAIGHKLGPVVPVYIGWDGACYHARICERCEKRAPASEEDARKKAENTAHISGLMNADRARLGFAPTSWDY